MEVARRAGLDSVEALPDHLMGVHDRLLLALERLLVEVQWVGDTGLREGASLAMLDAIDLAEELGVMRGGEAGSGAIGWPSGTRIGGKREVFK